MKIMNIESLQAERSRLKLIALEHEKTLHLAILGAEQQVGPFIKFLFPKAKSTLNESSQTADWFHKSLQTAIPFFVDRITLGTKRLLINRILTGVLQFIAGKVSSEKIVSVTQNLLKKSFAKLNQVLRK